MYDLPPTIQSLDGAVPPADQLPNGARQGRNDFDNNGYGGPCPGYSEHRYVFMLFALDTKLNLPAGATRAQLDEAMKGHVLARGKFEARFHR
jgi:Raf kinase inhibitor-like YbhB/YbcL family protein